MLSLIGIVAFGVVARVTNDPNWKLDKDEIEQLGKGLYPVAMKYAGTNAEYAPEALAIITIAGLVAPRILSNANSGQKGKGKNLHAETTSPPNPNGLGRVTLNESSAI
jgi:hypothetical protein